MSEQSKREIEVENQEWRESLDYVIERGGPERAETLLRMLRDRARRSGAKTGGCGTTPYVNTIPVAEQHDYPGDRDLERRIKSINRWNAMAMVVRANRESDGIGGHISTYASQATLFQVAFNHFLRGPEASGGGDIVYYQGHASPGVYARAFLEGRLSEEHLHNFRRELRSDAALSSYPHPWLMPEFWQFPSVSMGLAPIMAIYQARFNRYLTDRGIRDTSKQRVWAFIGDGETDEPEAMGALTLAGREELDNLVFVVNCNLQRLDGPVRGNGQIIQELESAFAGAGWNVVKVIWGSDWDELFDKDEEGVLMRYLEDMPDGKAQKLAASDGAYIRESFFGQDERLAALVEDCSDEELRKLNRGGHDPLKVYNAYRLAVSNEGAPTVVLAQTIKGYGLGEAGEGKNISHQQKKLNEEELRDFRSRFSVPVSDEGIKDAPFYRPKDDSDEVKYVHERRDALGGSVPVRSVDVNPIDMPDDDVFAEFFEGTGDRNVATTMAFVRLLANLLKDDSVGKLVVPIVPDEARTFGMESLFRQVGIYSHVGQKYEPVDRESLLYYREMTKGAILEEGITEAGSLSSFIAAGTAYATHGVNTIPVFLFYSMFGLQRVGDLAWAAADARAKGFLVGGTAGRSTLPGEGLQHQDGQSHLYAFSIPTLRSYDPAYAYEIAAIVREGIRRMYVEGENISYYITIMNETYRQPPMPDGVEDGILSGIYRLRTNDSGNDAQAHLLASGAIVNEALEAADLLEQEFDVAADVWSATSFKTLYQNADETERWNRSHPDEDPKRSFLEQTFRDCGAGEDAVFVAATDYVKAVPTSIAPWVPGTYSVLGTDGFGRSDTRAALRNFFEVDARHIALAALASLAREKKIDAGTAREAVDRLEIDPEKAAPALQ